MSTKSKSSLQAENSTFFWWGQKCHSEITNTCHFKSKIQLFSGERAKPSPNPGDG